MSRNENERKVPDPEVVPVAQRRQFSVKEKLRVLEEAEAPGPLAQGQRTCTEPGEVRALLRRGYTPHI